MGTLSNQKTGIYYDSFKDEIEEWEQKLQQISTTLDQLIQVQRQWIYLRDILDNQDQQDKQLIGDKDRFDKLSARVSGHMDRINTNRNVIISLIYPDFL
jgi:dynein heavy chain